MSQPPPTNRPGQNPPQGPPPLGYIMNGHRWNGQAWIPLAQGGSPGGPEKPWYKKWYVWVIAVLGLGIVGSALGDSEALTASPVSPAPAPTVTVTATATTTRTVTASPSPSPTPSPTADPVSYDYAGDDALTILGMLAVKGRAPQTGYDRAMFGQTWADVDRNGCDTRNDILARDLKDETFKAGTNDCVVLAGVLTDPYTATTIDFLRGEDTSNDVQIDHVVTLSDAWQKGAQQLDLATRTQFANDPLNLLAVDGPANSQKGDGDAATWLPPNKAFRCEYVARQVAIKYKYNLWVTQAESDAIKGILESCPTQELPEADGVVTTTPTPTTVPTTKTAAPATTQAADNSSADVYYANCTEARAAGAAPLHAGQPGYRSALDRDKDGVACE